MLLVGPAAVGELCEPAPPPPLVDPAAVGELCEPAPPPPLVDPAAVGVPDPDPDPDPEPQPEPEYVVVLETTAVLTDVTVFPCESVVMMF